MKSSKPPRKPLDTLVKLGLGVLIGGFLMIGLGMFLSRPDRTIPPYSVGAQDGITVLIHTPSWTSDPEIRTLLERFRSKAQETRNFAPMKIRPTTPDDPQGRYQRMKLYVFSDHQWAEAEKLRRYLSESTEKEDMEFKRLFESMVRGGLSIDLKEVVGWLGPVGGQRIGQADSEVEWLFNEPARLTHEIL
ncbi:MAG: hypothetical protein MRJ96_05690 [Nitrospirales bacterium]|nr:hypothetical protein [Nitrospira sp.]MDR4500926.1 hypothetical protein [Nitrospirales bacterium]